MIQYEGMIYRPPSEARSLILQATVGCSHNRCAFCTAYQQKHFRIKPQADLFKEIDGAAAQMPDVRRVFLADGDALVIPTDRLLRILEKLYDKFPTLQRVTLYGSPQNFANKSAKDLTALRKAGLTMIYYGIESGDNEILKRIKKPATAEDIVAAGLKARNADIDLSATVILGLAGPNLSDRHAKATAKIINQIAPRYASALTLMLEPRKPTFQQIFNDPTWRMLNQTEILKECRTFLSNINAEGITFRSNHASNYLSLAGDLQKDKQELLQKIDKTLKNPNSPAIRPEHLRRL